MTIETISLKEVLNYLDSGMIFSMGWRTYNHSKKEGGEWRELFQAVKYGATPPGGRTSTEQAPRELVRNPQHFLNSTRNIKDMETGEIKKIHIRLIMQFNQKTVM